MNYIIALVSFIKETGLPNRFKVKFSKIFSSKDEVLAGQSHYVTKPRSKNSLARET